jgi:hypothetical protein
VARTRDPAPSFPGFDRPEANWFRMPNSWTDITADISSIAELKVVEYILRHTWGYAEYDLKKHITIDEFVRGRHRQEGGRLDRGTGLSERAVYDGLRKAVTDGLIEEEIDDSDRGRVKKWYCLRMRGEAENGPNLGMLQSLQSGVQSLHPPLQTLHPNPAEFAPRSKTDTLERQDEESVSNSRIDHRPLLNEDDAATGSPGRVPASADGSVLDRTSGTAGEQPRRGEGIGTRVRRARPARIAQQEPDYQVIQAYIADFAREMNDRASLRVSTARAYNLYRRAALPRDEFLEQLYAARAIVNERTPAITSTGEPGPLGTPVKHRVAYYFAVLEDLLGLRAEADEDADN